MATIKVKFRPSSVEGMRGTIFYQVIHNRVVRQQKTPYRLYADEWDNQTSEIISRTSEQGRKNYLSEIDRKIRKDIHRFHKIIHSFDNGKESYAADDIIAEFTLNNPKYYLFTFMESVIANLKAMGKIRTSETYASSLNSFMGFRDRIDLTLDEIDSDMIMAYESYLHNRGINPNSSSFYMRNLRAVYNRAVEKGLTTQRFPFKHVYTGIDKTPKRAITLKAIKQIREMDLSKKPALDFARDMFLFSFYTRGMSFIDIAYLRKKDLNGKILSYRRHKTKQQLFIKWERCMQEIVDKYDIKRSNYLLPIIKPHSKIEERKQYIYSAHNINRNLKIIGQELDLPISLTMYVARHTWASIAKSKNVPLSIISEGMGHDSEATTRIYLASLDTTAIDKANSMILRSLL